MEIKSGIGIGDIRFGISEQELIALLGRPDLIETEEYVKGSGDWYKTLWYFKMNVNFTFNIEDDNRLGTITIEGPGYELFGQDLHGRTKKDVKKYIVQISNEIPKDEDWTSDPDSSFECLDHDGLGILFWFNSGVLSKLECSYLFASDNETIIWP